MRFGATLHVSMANCVVELKCLVALISIAPRYGAAQAELSFRPQLPRTIGAGRWPRRMTAALQSQYLSADTAYGRPETLNWIVNEKKIEPHSPIIDKVETVGWNLFVGKLQV
jgi:hypothetical protein